MMRLGFVLAGCSRIPTIQANMYLILTHDTTRSRAPKFHTFPTHNPTSFPRLQTFHREMCESSQCSSLSVQLQHYAQQQKTVILVFSTRSVTTGAHTDVGAGSSHMEDYHLKIVPILLELQACLP